MRGLVEHFKQTLEVARLHIDAHTIIAVYFMYNNWRSVKFATMSDDDGKDFINNVTTYPELKAMSEDWVMVYGG